MRKVISILLIAVLLSVFIVGCSGGTKPAEPEVSEPEVTEPDTPAPATTPAPAPEEEETPAPAPQDASPAPTGQVAYNHNINPENYQYYIQTAAELTPVYGDPQELLEKATALLGHKPTMAISTRGLTNEWSQNVYNGACKFMDELGITYTESNASGEETQQVVDLENAMARQVDGIVVAGGIAASLQTVLEQIHNAGIQAATVDVPSNFVVTNVTSDNFSGACQLNIKMCLDIGGAGEIGVLYQAGWHTLDIRRWMLDEILKDFTNVVIVAEAPTDSKNAVPASLASAETFLYQYPNLEAIWTAYGLPSIGAAQAVTQSGRDVFVYTIDNDMALCEVIATGGPIKAALAQTSPLLGSTNAFCVLKAMAGEGDEIGLQTYVPAPIVTVDNMKQVGPAVCGDFWIDI